MKYCYHIWAGPPNCYLDTLEKLQKQVYRAVGPAVSASLDALVRCQSVAIT